MVTIANKHLSAAGGIDFQPWLQAMEARFSGTDLASIRRAVELAASLYAEKTTLTGAPLLDHALGTASILATQNMDVESIVAAVLQAATEGAPERAEQVAEGFGRGVAALVDGVVRMGLIGELGGAL